MLEVTLYYLLMYSRVKNKCIKIYELDPAHFLFVPGLAWRACLKKAELKLELLTDVDMLLMVEKGIRGGICHGIHRYVKANNKYMKNYSENKDSSYIQYLDANNLYGWVISQKLPVNGFEWVKDISSINKKLDNFIKLIKNYGDDSNERYILKVDIKYPKSLHNLHSDLPFLPQKMKINKCHKLVYNLYSKKN